MKGTKKDEIGLCIQTYNLQKIEKEA